MLDRVDPLPERLARLDRDGSCTITAPVSSPSST